MVFKKVISVGGDTDTNACVVCAVIGALVGFKNLPTNMVGKVLSFDCTKDTIKRDKFLSVKFNAVPSMDKLLKSRAKASDILIIKNDYKVPEPI